MKKTFFTLLVITFTIQGFSQNSIEHFHNLRNQFSVLTIESSQVSDRFDTLGQYSEWNSGEHSNMGQGNLADNWNFIRDRFEDLEFHFNQMRGKFANSETTFHEIGNLLGNFDGTYGSLSGLPTLFDGSFSSLSGTPTTLAGYGIGGDLQINSVLSESGYTAISINPYGEVSFYNPLQLDRINSPLGNRAISINADGDVGFFNPLMLETINSYGGNPASCSKTDLQGRD